MHVRIRQGLEILADILCDELSDAREPTLSTAPASPGVHRRGRRNGGLLTHKGGGLAPTSRDVLAEAQKVGR